MGGWMSWVSFKDRPGLKFYLLSRIILMKLFNSSKSEFLSLNQDNSTSSSLKSREFLPHEVVSVVKDFIHTDICMCVYICK